MFIVINPLYSKWGFKLGLVFTGMRWGIYTTRCSWKYLKEICMQRFFFLCIEYLLYTFILCTKLINFNNINPIPAGGAVNLTPTPCMFFLHSSKSILVWGCWNFLTFPTYPKHFGFCDKKFNFCKFANFFCRF